MQKRYMVLLGVLLGSAYIVGSAPKPKPTLAPAKVGAKKKKKKKR